MISHSGAGALCTIV